jgi:hypothetical protein
MVVSMLFDVVGVCGGFPGIRQWWQSRDFRKFFGSDAVKSGRLSLVLGSYTRCKNTRFEKRSKPVGGEEHVTGVCSIRVVQYAASQCGKYLPGLLPLQVVRDEDNNHKWDGTFICSGGNNRMTEAVKSEMIRNHAPCFCLNQKWPQATGIVHAQITRIKNTRSPGNYLFVCEGNGKTEANGEWGTSGAVWFLFKNWKTLSKRYGTNDFSILLEVQVNSDESAREIASLSSASCEKRCRDCGSCRAVCMV